MGKTKLKGIDISNWNSKLNFDQIAPQIDFMICKATEGLTFNDKLMKGFISSAKKHKLLYGCYHYARNNDPKAEAEHFYRIVKPYVGTALFALDIEETTIKDPAKFSKTFCDTFYKLSGVRPLIYTYHAYRSRFKGYENLYKNYDLWLAGYPRAYKSWTLEPCPYSAGNWPYIAIWQFTSSGVLKGNAGKLDLNYAYMTVTAWKEYAKTRK